MGKTKLEMVPLRFFLIFLTSPTQILWWLEPESIRKREIRVLLSMKDFLSLSDLMSSSVWLLRPRGRCFINWLCVEYQSCRKVCDPWKCSLSRSSASDVITLFSKHIYWNSLSKWTWLFAVYYEKTSQWSKWSQNLNPQAWREIYFVLFASLPDLY